MVTKQQIVHYNIIKKTIDIDYSLVLLNGVNINKNVLSIVMNDQLI